jgi:2,4-dienoyl-CoA reductase-like NADH-dependent reductase (Old Yellow Enzyme family)
MSTEFAKPLQLASGVTLSNRIAKSSLSEGLGDQDQAPTLNLIRLYRRWAGSGAGLLITGNVMVDRRALGEAGNIAIEDNRHTGLLREWAQAATSGGAHAWVQLNHPGRQAPSSLNNAAPVAPSPVAVTGAIGALGKAPRALTDPEITEIIGRFATAARVAVDAGFTGVQIHAAHGYLISQFLSPLTNQRDDRWGGSTQNRQRFLVEIVRAVRAELGPHVPIGVKLNSADFQHGGMTEDESTLVVLALADEGIDLLEISGGNYESTAFMGASDAKASTRAREAYFLDYAEKVRAALTAAGADLPLMVTGGFRTASVMNDAIADGAADVIGLGRPLIIEPELPQRLLDGATGARRVEVKKIRIKHLEGMGELMWYGVQLRRLGNGKDPDPNRHPLRNLPQYLTSMGMLGRPQRRGFST